MSSQKIGEQLLHRVRDFHEAMGVPVSNRPAPMSVERLEIRTQWLREELNELSVATSVVAQLDASLDILYLALGNLLELGVPLEPTFLAVHHANMQKRWPDGSVHRSPSGKILKPPGWEGPEGVLKNLLNLEDDSAR